ncbi:MAG: cysteine desulfurase family protein [Minisyncoccia bacterium]|jgi:cysteine desulfurase
MKRIYLDYAASTPVDPTVLRAIAPYFSERFGNPGSLHAFGQEAIAAVDRSRETIARALGADFRQIVFIASATEANNLVLRGVVRRFQMAHDLSGARARRAAPHLIVSAIEHESVLEAARDLARENVRVTYVPVGAHGIADLKKIKESLTPETALVSVMYANNEIGTMQPITEIGKIIEDFRKQVRSKESTADNRFPAFHTDAAQAFQFLDCDANALGVDFMTISSHKMYGPKGAGALFVRDADMLLPIVAGGGQEFGLRSGTENVPAIVGFAKAVELVTARRESEAKRIAALRDRLWSGLKDIFPEAETNGSENNGERLPNILNVYFPGHAAQDLLTKFDLRGLSASSGSACRSRAMESSYVVQALGHSKERAKESIRFSLGRPTTEKEVAEALKIVKGAL